MVIIEQGGIAKAAFDTVVTAGPRHMVSRLIRRDLMRHLACHAFPGA
jgi:hypothetical protein